MDKSNLQGHENEDTISRQAAIDALHMHLMYRMGTDSNKKRLDEWINNLPSAQPKRTCVNCGRTANNGGWYADGGTRCPIEEHYALPKDGFCYLWKGTLRMTIIQKGEPMSETVREMTREELVASNNELRAENEKLKAELHEARLAVEHNRHVAEENQLKYELHYKDGVIYGMKYAIKCNGISGGEVDKI